MPHLPIAPSDTALYAGVMVVFTQYAVASVIILGLVWANNRRNIEYLLAALTSASVAVFGLGMSMSLQAILTSPADVPAAFRGSQLAILGVLWTPTLMMHTSFHFVRPPSARHWLRAAYTICLVMSVMLLSDLLLHAEPQAFSRQEFLGLSLIGVPAYFTPWGWMFTLPALTFVGLGMRQFLEAYRQGQQDAHFALSGAILFGATLIHDIGATQWGVDVIHLLPAGHIIFAGSILLMMVARYGLLSRQLESKTIDLARRNEELQSAYKNLERAQSELLKSKRLAVTGELAAVIAHEVRNPLAIVSNAVTSLGKARGGADREQELLDIIEQELERLERLIAQLSDYARPMTVEHESIEVSALVAQSISRVEHEKNVTIDFSPPKTAMSTSGDPELLRQALENILQNAIEALEGNGHVLITAGVVEEGLVVEVHDDGLGMTPATLARASAPFFSTRATGTGLGLALVDRVIQAHGGQLQITSEVHSGTCVRLTLPRETPRSQLSVAATLSPHEPEAPYSTN